MENIIISGTPGCGKTSVSTEIPNMIDAKIISLNELALSKKFSFDYDKDRKTYIVDFEIFLPYIIKKIKKIKKDNPQFLVVESHFSDILPSKYIDYIFILRCNPDELTRRLKEKEFDTKKIMENVQAEILGNCVNYFLQKNLDSPLLEIDTTNLNIKDVAKIIVSIVVEKKDIEKYRIGNVDWLEKLFQEDRLKEFFD